VGEHTGAKETREMSMSADPQYVLEVIPPGQGLVLDLAGGRGTLRQSLEILGYRYINVDIKRFGSGEPSLIGDAHILPFQDASFDIVISKDTLEHFIKPWVVVKEVHRLLKDDGRFIIWVPFMHPFHGDDFYRYSPLGLQHLLSDFDIVLFESPLQVFTVVGMAGIEMLKRLHLGFVEQPLEQICGALDHILIWFQKRQRPASFAAAYRIVAYKRKRLC
jgi:SAM-dependent methyltransferase